MTYVCLRSGRRREEDGAVSAEQVVFVPGVAASSSRWTAMEKRCQKAGSRTFAIDVGEGWRGFSLEGAMRKEMGWMGVLMGGETILFGKLLFVRNE